MILVNKLQAGGSKIVAYFRESFAELRRVRWPKGRELVSYTLVTLVSVAIITLLIYLFDLGFSYLLKVIGLGASR